MESTVVAQSTAVLDQPVSADPEFQARLAVVSSKATVLRRGGVETEVQQAQSMNIHLDDRIQVMRREDQDEQGYGILHFPDYLNVELFGNTSVLVADVRQAAEGSTEVTLELSQGDMFVHLNEQMLTQVTIWTPYTTIKTLAAGTEFDVCRNEELTCVVVKRGVVEINAQGKKEIIKAGTAGIVLKDQAPSPSFCAPNQIINDWEERYREFANAPALDIKISGLVQEPCPVTAAGLPLDAHILYQDEFTNQSSGWDRGKTDNFTIRYAGGRYYQVQIQGPDDQYLAFVPNRRDYEDVNVDIRAIVEAPNSGDFRYGVIFRRSGDQYYAFAVSPSKKRWYFLKSSPDGLEVLKEGTDERMRGFEAREVLRLEADGSIFLLYINDRFIHSISDPDYLSGEIGLFVETMDSSDALIRFDSILIWDVPPVLLIPDTGGREYCFNASDDDGDGWTDKADPDCQRPGVILTSPPTSIPLPTNTLLALRNTPAPPTSTPIPSPTQPSRTPRPTRTRTLTPQPTIPKPTNTPTLPLPTLPLPTITLPPVLPTATEAPPPTATNPPPTATDPPPPTATDPPPPTEPPPTDPPTEPPVSSGAEVIWVGGIAGWTYGVAKYWKEPLRLLV